MIKPWEQRCKESPNGRTSVINAVDAMLAEITELRAYKAACEDQDPVTWIRFTSDGGYEGPIMDGVIEECRKKSGGWTPLFMLPPATPKCFWCDDTGDIHGADCDHCEAAGGAE